MAGRLYLGTCSWSYSSWAGTVYKSPHRGSADYLAEYATVYETAEVDSWYYRPPTKADAEAYARAVPEGFRFTVKVPQDLTLTHKRPAKGTPPRGTAGEPNPNFLSLDAFNSFVEAAAPVIPKVDALMFEFEYLNRQKIESQEKFLDCLDAFFALAPQGLPYAVEVRNGPWLNETYFAFLGSRGIIPVFSEKIYLPHLHEVYPAAAPHLGPTAVIRLLGGDRGEIEAITKEDWSAVVLPKPELPRVVEVASDMLKNGKNLYLNVNNHYEGSAPVTIANIRRLLNDA